MTNKVNRPFNRDRSELEVEREHEHEHEAQFREMVGGPLEAMDDLFEPEVPQAAWFAELVIVQKKEIRRKMLRDLLLFWIVGCLALGLMTLLITQNVIVFLLLQLFAMAGAGVFIGRNEVRRVKREWTH
jgi:hypothetical protein